MVEYDRDPSNLDCLVSLKVMVDKEGELKPDELDEIDDVMLDVGSQRTGQRIGVSSTNSKTKARVKYVYQETLMGRSIENAKERLNAFTSFDDPSIIIDTEIIEYK